MSLPTVRLPLAGASSDVSELPCGDPGAGLSAEQVAAMVANGPRYTSYPPATCFGHFDTGQVRGQLETLAANRANVSLYVHIPFCRQLCWYCGCNVVATRDASRGESYVDDLLVELELVAARLQGCTVTEIALGGGSPNFLAPATMTRLLEAIARALPIAQSARRSVELDPRNTSPEIIATLAAQGFTSVSIGVQDFARQVQAAIGRHQSVEQTANLIKRCRAAGFTDVNLDLVYGLPNQDDRSFENTLNEVIAMQPDRLAVFGYAHMPSKNPKQKLVERAGELPSPLARASLLLKAADVLGKAGYVALGIDHFARPDSSLARAAQNRSMTRSFQGYVERIADAIIGLGASAISSTDTAFWQNAHDLEAWQTIVHAGRYPAVRGMDLSPDDRLRRDIIQKLMCDGEVALNSVAQEFGIDAESYFAKELSQLASETTLATVDAQDANTVRCTPLGRVLARNVCQVFDRYNAGQPRNTTNFSSTI